MSEATIDHIRAHAELRCPAGGAREYQPPEAALRELLRPPGGGYAAASGGSQLAPYRQGMVSLPDDVSDAKELDEICSEHARQYLVGEGERMFRRPGDCHEPWRDDTALKYVDPVLSASRAQYVRFIRDLKRRGLVVFD